MKVGLINLLILFVLIIFVGCSPHGPLYRFDDDRRISVYQLEDSSLSVVKKYLSQFSNKAIQDTIIIKYDYNNETCWSILDENVSDEEMKRRYLSSPSPFEAYLSVRPGVSFFHFRQPGNNINKIIKYDPFIIIDTDQELYNFFFKEKCTCGNSILILPDGRYIFTRSDSHTNAVFYSSKQITGLLQTRRN